MGSIEPFNRLVKLAARAFYDDITTKGENQAKIGRSDNRGIAVVILDALTRRQWVREDDLAKDLKLHSKQLRRILRFFEEEKLITRDHRKESAKGAKIYNAAVAAVGDRHQTGREGEEKVKMHTQSYCCLDYSQIYDVVRYRLHRMRKMLKDELESKNTIQEYVCPNCGKRYTALDAPRLISLHDEYFHCESCNGVLVEESDKLAVQELGDGDDIASKRRRQEKLRDMLTKMEEQLKPLVDQLARVKDLAVPEFGTLQAWEVRAHTSGRAAGDLNANDPSKFSPAYAPPMGNTKVEVDFSGEDNKGDTKMVNKSGPTKVLPPWMITKSMMNLTTEQRGGVKPDASIGDASSTMELSNDKKSATTDDETANLQDIYVQAYYAALLMRQREQEELTKKEQCSPNATNSNETDHVDRQIGVKSKRDGDYDGDDVEWEEEPPTGKKPEHFIVDLNVEAQPSDEEDDIDWEEG